VGHYYSEMGPDPLRGYYPTDEEMPPATVENLRYNMARARRAEEELHKLESGLGAFRRLLKGVGGY